MTAPLLKSSRRRRLAVVVGVCAITAIAVWWFTRGPVAPQPPAVDLSHAEPEVADAIRTASERARQLPQDATAWGHLGMLLRAHDFDTDSVAALRMAEQLDPADYRWPYLQGLTLILFDPDAGLACLRRAAERAPADRPQPRLRLAEALLERGDAEEANRLADEVLRRSDMPRANWVKARAAAERGDWAEVLARTERCRTAEECRKKVALLRGEALVRRGETTKADAEFHAAAALPEDGGWPDPVVEQVERLRAGTPARIARAGAALNAGRVNEAIAELSAVVRRSPPTPQPYLMLGEILIRAGDPAAAQPVLEELTARFPDSVEGWFQLGNARFLLGNVRDAADLFRTVIALKPDHALAHYNLGLCLRKLGDRSAARAEFEQALRCRPDHEPSRRALQELDAGK